MMTREEKFADYQERIKVILDEFSNDTFYINQLDYANKVKDSLNSAWLCMGDVIYYEQQHLLNRT